MAPIERLWPSKRDAEPVLRSNSVSNSWGDLRNRVLTLQLLSGHGWLETPRQTSQMRHALDVGYSIQHFSSYVRVSGRAKSCRRGTTL